MERLSMKIYKEVTVAHLKGDLTQSGVIYNIINLLAVSMQKIVSGGDKKIRIDCEMIHTADIRGLQMLYVWMQSARTRGVEPELINLSRSLRQSMKRMGFDNCFKIISNHKETLEFIKRHEKMFIKRERRGELCLST
jgi:anti-anti-sigma regulatory factor